MLKVRVQKRSLNLIFALHKDIAFVNFSFRCHFIYIAEYFRNKYPENQSILSDKLPF